MTRAKLLYLNSYTNPHDDSPASDEVGYGITASWAIRNQLRQLGYEIYELPNPGCRVNADSGQSSRKAKLQWIYTCYQQLLSADLREFEVLFFFHIFHQFPCEAKRILLDLGNSKTKLIGYTLGSHWDPTDKYRSLAHPGMHMVDLANLHCLDQILVVSEHFRDTAVASIAGLNRKLACNLNSKMTVVGLPIDDTTINRFRTAKANNVTIVYNHAPVQSKRPDVFFRIMEEILARFPVNLVVTRRFHSDSPGFHLLQRLQDRFRDRVTLGHTLPMQQYFETLWKTNIQVSTAEHESLGISTLEAMYTYNCCLLPNRCSYPEVVGPVHEVLYSSEQELYAKLCCFISNADRRISVARKLRERAEHYLPGQVVAKIDTVLREQMG